MDGNTTYPRRRIALLWLMFCALPMTIAAAEKQPPPAIPLLEDGTVGLREVYEAPEVSADDLQARARVWIARNYKSAPDVTMIDQPGVLIVKGVFADGANPMGIPIHHRLTIEASTL